MKNILILAAGAPAWKPSFIESLNRYGIKPLGIVESSHKTPEFDACFANLYGVSSLNNIDEVLHAAKWLHKNFNFELIECFEEHWKRLEADIREAVKLPGRTRADLAKTSSKTHMKQVFADVGVKVASSVFAETLDECLQKAEGKRYPMFAKPDMGVGAQGTFRIDSANDFQKIVPYGQENRFPEKYIVEDLLEGEIITFDGLVDFEGNIVNCFQLQYPDVAQIVSGKSDQCVMIAQDFPDDFLIMGRNIVDSYQMHGEFFHVEFKNESDGLYGMDANIRLCGACAPWMYGSTLIDSIPDRWARMIAGEVLAPKLTLDRCGAMICRRDESDVHFEPYRHDHNEILHHLGNRLLYLKSFEPCFRDNLNTYAYFVRAEAFSELEEMRSFIQTKLYS